MTPLGAIIVAGEAASPLPRHYWFSVQANQLEVRDPTGTLVGALNLSPRPKPKPTAVAAWALAMGAWLHSRALAR